MLGGASPLILAEGWDPKGRSQRLKGLTTGVGFLGSAACSPSRVRPLKSFIVFQRRQTASPGTCRGQVRGGVDMAPLDPLKSAYVINIVSKVTCHWSPVVVWLAEPVWLTWRWAGARAPRHPPLQALCRQSSWVDESRRSRAQATLTCINHGR